MNVETLILISKQLATLQSMLGEITVVKERIAHLQGKYTIDLTYKCVGSVVIELDDDVRRRIRELVLEALQAKLETLQTRFESASMEFPRG